jgi:hypothetical protein
MTESPSQYRKNRPSLDQPEPLASAALLVVNRQTAADSDPSGSGFIFDPAPANRNRNT